MKLPVWPGPIDKKNLGLELAASDTSSALEPDFDFFVKVWTCLIKSTNIRQNKIISQL